MWNLKTNEQTQQNRSRIIGTESKKMVTRGDGGWEKKKRGERD